MKLSMKMRLTMVLAAVFATSFLAVLSAISLTQSAYSTPSRDILMVEGMGITVGPPPNSTGIPLDTTIVIDALSSTGVSALQIIPEVPIASRTIETSGPLLFLNTFYLAQQLEPANTYCVSTTIMDVPVSWSFTTTSMPFTPTISFFLATNALVIALATAISSTLVGGLVLLFKRKHSE